MAKPNRKADIATSLWLDDESKEALTTIVRRTGLSASEVMRRLLVLHAAEKREARMAELLTELQELVL